MTAFKIFHNKRILVLSPEHWGHPFVSKHQFAILLASLGNQVFFLNPPGDDNRCSPSAYENLFIVDYRPTVRGLNRFPSWMSRFFWKSKARRLATLAGGGFDVVWSFDPYRFQNLNIFNAATKIYYAADWHQGRNLERRVADTADFVLSPSSLVLEAVETKAKKIKVNHGVAAHFFSAPAPMTLPGQQAIKAGYVGNPRIKSLDKELVLQTAQRNPTVDFVFAGDAQSVRGDAAWDRIFALKNVYSVGPLPNDQVPAFLAACDLLTIFYDTETYRKEASNSHKILEYLSSGKVVVSTPVEEYKNRPGLLCMPRVYAEYAALFENIVYNLEEYNSAGRQSVRKNYAAQNSYRAVLATVDARMARAQSEKSK